MNAPVDFVFLHGGGQAGWVWDETLAALALQTGGGFGRALTLDIPGCGSKRGRPTDDLDMDAVAAELAADIDASGFRDAVLVGHSQAGTVLPRLLELRPKLFRRAIYISCIAPQPGRSVRNYRDAETAQRTPDDFDPTTNPPPEQLRDLLQNIFCNDMGADETRAFMAKLGADAWPNPSYTATDWRYGHLGAVPASYFICLQDKAVSVPLQEQFAERFRASRLVRFDAGHQVMNTRPHTLAEALRHEAAVGAA